ncbi:MAG: hypothetical protein GWN53_17195 [Gammaproteobacteria bacterium]|nr:hypothetical protein [Gammaproteobacteria bacterium]
MSEVWDISEPEPAITHAELLLLHNAVLDTTAQTVVELGVETGNSTLALLMGLRYTGGYLVSYDIDPCDRAFERVDGARLGTRWLFRQRHSLSDRWDRPIDVLWIDSSHEFHETRQELRFYEPHVRTGGIIAMHDIESVPDVERAIGAYFDGGYRIERHRLRGLRANGLALIYKGEA